MIDTMNTALEQRQKTFNGVRMNVAAHIFFLTVVNNLMVEGVGESVVCAPIIRNDSRTLLGVSSDDRLKLCGTRFGDLLGDHPTATLNDSHDNGLLCGGSTNKAFVLPADIGFIGFDCTGQGRTVDGIRTNSVTNPVKHEPSRFLSHANIPMQLKGANALLVSRNEIDRHEPLLERESGVFKDCPHFDGELFMTCPAFEEFAGLELIDFLGRMTVGAFDLVAPTGFQEVVPAGLLVGEPLGDVQKASEFGSIGTHGYLLIDRFNIQHFGRFVKYIIPKDE